MSDAICSLNTTRVGACAVAVSITAMPCVDVQPCSPALPLMQHDVSSPCTVTSACGLRGTPTQGLDHAGLTIDNTDNNKSNNNNDDAFSLMMR